MTRLPPCMDGSPKPHTDAGPRADHGARRASVLGGMALAAWIVSGCAAPHVTPVDLAEPGWVTHESAAVWHPPGDAPELAGELLVATHPDGRRLVQFSKQSLPLVTALAGRQGWSVSSPLRRTPVGGRGMPTDRVPWFQIGTIPPGKSTSPRWRLEPVHDGVWRLSATRGGEFLEGPLP